MQQCTCEYCGTNPTKHNSGQKWCGDFFFLWPHISLKPSKYKGGALSSVANCFQLKVAKTGHLLLLDDLIKVSSLIYSIFICI